MNSIASAVPSNDVINPATILINPKTTCKSPYTGSVPSPLSGSSIDPTKIRIKPRFLEAALQCLDFGFKVIPILPGTKIPALKHEPWLTDLSPQTIKDYWSKHSDHELAFITGDNIVVFDADTPESIKALKDIEEFHNVKPNLVSKTHKGEHHFFNISLDTYVKSDSHDSKKHPKRIDIKTGRGMIVLPPSTGKTVLVKDANNVNGLVTVDQTFIDSVFLMNDREVPRPPEPMVSLRVDSADHKTIIELLNCIDPDGGYEDWLHCLMAVHHETGGCDEGLDIVDAWSMKGQKYKDRKEIEIKWRSLKQNVATSYTLGTLIKMAKDAGGDVSAIIGNDSFELCEYEVVNPSTTVAPDKVIENQNPLNKYSLLGMSDEIKKQIMEEVYVLNDIVLHGQASVIYAAPNTGKTLLTLHLLAQGIKQKKVDPKKVYYINVDDTANGLLEKLLIAEEYGFHMLTEGYRDFKVSEFLTTIASMIESGNTRGVIIILDTLKKFADLMDKRISGHFGKIMRSFVMKGGTVIGLAHTNKNKGRDGKRVHAGTSDIMEDFDCAYILDTVSEDANKKVVEFTNTKKRGNVALSVSFSYALERDIPYNELLLSVQKVDDTQLIPLKQAAEVLSDAEVIAAIGICINDGVNSKMKLSVTAAERANVSQRRALKVIDKYTGDDPAIHRWSFVVGERGAKVFMLLEHPSAPIPDITSL